MLERSAGVNQGGGSRPESDRVGAVGATDRPMALYTHGREAVTYGRGSVWIVIGILVVLFAVFFGWILFVH